MYENALLNRMWWAALTRSKLTLFWRRLGSRSSGTLARYVRVEGMRWCSVELRFSFLAVAWWNPSTQEAKARGSGVRSQPGLVQE